GFPGQPHNFVGNLPGLGPVRTQGISIGAVENRDSIPFGGSVVDAEPNPLQVIEEHGVILEPGSGPVKPSLLHWTKNQTSIWSEVVIRRVPGLDSINLRLNDGRVIHHIVRSKSQQHQVRMELPHFLRKSKAPAWCQFLQLRSSELPRCSPLPEEFSPAGC